MTAHNIRITGDGAGNAGDVEPARTSKDSNLITVHPTPEWLTLLQQAGVDLLAYHGAQASDVAGPFAEAARRIQDHPGARHPLRPAREPPTGFDTVQLLQWAAQTCARHPTATFQVKMRDAHSTPRWRG